MQDTNNQTTPTDQPHYHTEAASSSQAAAGSSAGAAGAPLSTFAQALQDRQSGLQLTGVAPR